MIELTREQWDCYLHTPQNLVEKINNSFSKILENSVSPEMALRNMYVLLCSYIEYGFRDTECEQVVVDEINKYFYDEDDVDRWSVGFI